MTQRGNAVPPCHCEPVNTLAWQSAFPKKQPLNGETVIKTDSYTFTATADGTSTQVASYNGLSYTYDDNGNILSVSDGTNTTTYQYDSANQLVRENNQALGFTKVWTYDNAGNILSRTEYAYTTADDLSSLTATDAVTYQYTSVKWGDMLRVYDGQNLTYDASGNLTNDGKFTYTWAHGRELVCVTAPSGAQVLATYGADGLRTGRVVMYSSGTVRAAYTYVYNGSKLSKMTYGNYVVDITYDAAGTPLTMVINGQTTYHYVTNLQGDVIALTDETGAEVITYSYDAWGKVVSHTGTYATLNPLLYRGYVYDWETHHYYLQSRYYNPEWGRFINGDALATTGQGFLGNNMFAYCLNNPIAFADPNGEIAITTLILVGSIIIGVVSAGVTAYVEYKAGCDTEQIVYDSITVGLSTFCAAYSLGMTAYQCYQTYCCIYGKTPVTDINLSKSAKTTANTLPTDNITTSTPSVNNIPKEATKTLEYIDQKGCAPQGYKGGATFLNDGRNGGQVLPYEGMPYKEYDIYPYVKGSPRGLERLVIGSDQSAWFTFDHYKTFINIRK